MLKKAAIFLSLVLIVSVFSAINVPAAANLVKNGDFELTSDGKPSGWYLGGGTFGTDFKLDTKEKHGGTQSFSITNENGSIFYSNQSITAITAGADYKLSVWAKNEKSTSAALKMEFYSTPTFAGASSTGSEILLNIPVTNGEWKQFSVAFTVPANTKMLALYMRHYASGTVWFDDIELVKTGDAPASGEKGKNVLINSSFENLSSGNTPANWYLGGGSVGSGFELVTKDVHTGNNAIGIDNPGGKIMYSNQSVTSVYGGIDYELSVWVKTKVDAGVAFKAEFYNKAGTFSQSDSTGPEQLLQVTSTDGKWQQFTKTFTVPEGTKSVVVYFRHYGTGEAIFDDIELCPLGEIPASAVAAAEKNEERPDAPTAQTTKKEPVSGAVNLIQNSDMETLGDGGIPKDWDAFPQRKSTVEYTEEEAHGGKSSVKISTDEANLALNLAAVYQVISNIVPGAEYQFSAYVKNMGSSAYLKFEPYDTDVPTAGHGLGESSSGALSLKNEEWTEITYRYVAPENCKSIALYLRQSATGTTYWDDVTCYMTEEPGKLFFETDQYFYYSDWDHGTISTSINPYYSTYTGYTAAFKISDGDTVMHEEKFTISTKPKKILFDLSILKEKKKEYTLSVTLFDKDGKEITSAAKPAFKYDRPSTVSSEGYIIIDGKPFYPMYPNVVTKNSFYPEIKAMGCNGATVYAHQVETYIEDARANDLKLVVLLYSSMKPAGNAANVAQTKRLVEKFKDDPNILAWGIMDEPISQKCTEEDLLNSYKIIRDIDDMHPVYSVEAIWTDYAITAKFVDVLVTDPYPQGAYSPATHVAKLDRKAKEAVNFEKPVFSIVQSYLYNNYYPTNDDMRSMIYQSIFEGASGVGFFRYENARDGKNLNEVDLGNTIKALSGNELDDAVNAFAYKNYPVFNDDRKSDIWYRTYIKNGELYSIVLNRNDKSAVTGTIDMTSFDGKAAINGYKAEVLFGTDKYTVTSEGTLASVTLQPSGAAVYKITPNEPIDLSSITREAFEKGGFADTFNYPWAKAEISALAREGIVNSISQYLYEPGTNITRGDFAMFLVRTLGLTSDSTENFDDVDPDMHYAKEIAIGRASGILNGIGDNKFNPEAEISRQDLMTIIARGMKLSSDADISSFSDSGKISDYAISHVKAMIASGLIKGNADGTLNPLGNATRAEAAVIMHRIKGIK